MQEAFKVAGRAEINGSHWLGVSSTHTVCLSSREWTKGGKKEHWEDGGWLEKKIMNFEMTLCLCVKKKYGWVR
jgi:hypothetical protein